MNIQRYLVAFLIFTWTSNVAAQPAGTPQRVYLDDTGVPGAFVNPVNPVEIDGRPLTFINGTGDRTFVVTIPFTYTTSEAASAYAVADEDRGQQVVSEVVCNTLSANGDVACSTDAINALDTLEGFRVLAETLMPAKDTSIAKCLDEHSQSASCIVELLFWTASCRLEDQDHLLRFARLNELSPSIRANIELGASEFLKSLLDKPSSWPFCSPEEASLRQKTTVESLKTVHMAKPPIDPISADAKTTGLQARFATARVDLAKKILQEEIKKEIEILGTRLDLVSTSLETLRARLTREERRADNDEQRATLQCRLREVEAAGKLLASYGLDASVPYTGLPESIKTGSGCGTRSYGDGAQEALQSMLSERASEQGIEISGCETNPTGTACVASATILPYQSATFSPSVLAHHPTPRIRFSVSFFGETELPGNPNGYVTRIDASEADRFPKSQFGVQLGGDTSTSLEPELNPDREGTGQFRHSNATGALSFQYTGPVEASATLSFKSGDFGGTDDANKITATQYQAKAYGPRGVTFQYGKITFAKPSSGIAVNVLGEGMQVGTGPASLSYVVRRESDENKANDQNDDDDLWLLQVKNVPLQIPLLRTFDLVVLYGRNRRDDASAIDDVVPPKPQPYDYVSYGTEVRWGSKRVPALGGSVSLYHSTRNVHPPHNPDPTRGLEEIVDGRGTSGLARVSWTRLTYPSLTDRKQRVRPAFGISALFGYGTGDKERSTDENEGYLGEQASFSNDMLFLSRVAASKDFSSDIGRGLSNKRYAGLVYTDSRASVLGWISSHLFDAEDDIESRSTVLSLHMYEFVHEVHGRHWGGVEADIDFRVEAPKNIQWSLGGAYYKRSSAVELSGPKGLKEDLWSATAKLSIKLGGL